MRLKHGITFLSLIILIASCSSNEDEPSVGNSHLTADITVVAPLSGLGDNGYNDQALSGIFESIGSSEIEVSIIRPKDIQQAEAEVTEWCAREDGRRRLIVLSDNEYSAIAAKLTLKERQNALLFESDGKGIPDNIATFRISRYGSSYLSGCLAQGSAQAHIIGGRREDPSVSEAAAAFEAGYKESNPTGEVTTHYLSTSSAGWAMPDSLYRLVAEYPDDFFFPVAKGSNAGIFKYSRETPFVLLLIAGMDVDCSQLSKRVPFSVVIDVKSVVRDYVRRWIAGEDISGNRTFGMSDGVAQVRLSTLFYQINDVWEAYYSNPDYWQTIYDKAYQEALSKEVEYEESK